MRRVIYHVAATVDGFIARADGSFDFFPMEGAHVTDYVASLRTYDAVLMGRRTYEVGLKFGVKNPYPAMKSYVFSRKMQESPDPAVQIVADGVTDFVQRLKQEDSGDIYLCGGASLATQLLAAGLVDQIKLKLNPIVIGAGVSLLEVLPNPISLKLLDTKSYDNGVLLLTYGVS